MKTATKTEDKLVVVTLAKGATYLGVLKDNRIENALLMTGTPNRNVMEIYLKKRNLGELTTVKFSAVTDYTVEELDAKTQAEWEFVAGMFDMAKKQAKAFNENATFEALFAGKK